MPEPAVCAVAIEDVELALLLKKVEEMTLDDAVAARGVEKACDVTMMEDDDLDETADDT